MYGYANVKVLGFLVMNFLMPFYVDEIRVLQKKSSLP